MTDQPHSQALAYVSVGSNLEPKFHIEAGLDLLQKRVCVTAVSTFYCTEPIDRPGQPDYLNGVFEIRTDMPVSKLAPLVLHPVETLLGRVRTQDRYASRTLDLDLILYNDLESSSPSLKLPHPDIQRDFVWEPIRELLSRDSLRHPCQSAMLQLLPAMDHPVILAGALHAFSESLRVKLLPTS